MFGYIQANVKELKVREYELYRAYYCGLCHVLKDGYGRRGQLMLSYDLTFLVMLLSALYEPREEKKERRCAVHPLARHPQICSPVTQYAADLTILLGYRKAADDWADERSARGKMLSSLLVKDYRRAAQANPRQARILGRCVQQLAALEREGCRDVDRVSALTGSFLGEMFVWKKDLWESDLRRTGFYLGKFIYMMDAWDDRERDRKSGSYNIWNLLDLPEERILTMMQDTMACCCRAFETLPVVETAPILRNILYAGVWTKYAVGREEKKQPRSGRK